MLPCGHGLLLPAYACARATQGSGTDASHDVCCVGTPQEYSEAEAASAMRRMVQHHAANGWRDDVAQPAGGPAADDSRSAADGVASADIVEDITS